MELVVVAFVVVGIMALAAAALAASTFWRKAAIRLELENALLWRVSTMFYGIHEELRMDTPDEEHLRLRALHIAGEVLPDLPHRTHERMRRLRE